MYYKPVAQVLSEICSGVFKPDITKFDIKIFLEEKRFTKEQELGMVLYIMSEKSGIDFIFEHLDTIMEDKDIKKTVFKIYKKSFNELVSQVQKELIKVDKKLKLAKGR